MAAAEQGDDGHVWVEDLFQMQHHHLLNCLEHTTVSLIFRLSYVVELSLLQVQVKSFNFQLPQ